MRRPSWKTVSTLVTMIVIAGCSDSAISVPSAGPLAPALSSDAPEGMFVPDMSAPGTSAGYSNSSARSGDLTAEFTVTNRGGLFQIGSHAIYFPAKSICDVSSSSYGVDAWDAPCEAESAAVKIRAVVRTAKTGTWIDFTPAMRFVPSRNPAQWVVLYMNNPGVLGASDLSPFNVNYALKIGDKGIDESANDATMRTYVNSFLGFTFRRIKHFSGYSNSSGRSCDPAVEEDCFPVDENGNPINPNGINGGM